MKKIAFIFLLLAALAVFAYFKKQNDISSMLLKQNTNSAVATSTPKPSDSEMKPVTSDDSFTSIDSDLNNTVILNEDFSDLK